MSTYIELIHLNYGHLEWAEGIAGMDMCGNLARRFLGTKGKKSNLICIKVRRYVSIVERY